MHIGIIGTGTLAAMLGEAWTHAGHEIAIGGRSPEKARALADRLGHGTQAVAPRHVVAGRDAVLLAVSWGGVEDMLQASGAPEGTLAGTPLIDPTNAVEHGVGTMLTADGGSMARRIAELAPGAHVVKAFNLFPAEQWQPQPQPQQSASSALPADGKSAVTVPMCGDDPAALDVVSRLVRDVGAAPTVLGTLDRARQLEEVAGFVIGLAFGGTDPNSAIPRIP
ncbi:NADPH-dependent F420 reductase [Catenulispora pinisilvae]|uniref:NADPH-dependent F420 reductase n=1 Tax=Catenulispora pinisilvae TaxID=2705253 RepID=UPI0018923712|nr:NAD(P)-binding domain-containing protein [Catenulispora pinisilvae]